MVTSTIILTAAQNLCITDQRPKDLTTENNHPQIGFTTTKKLGSAVTRNRARRRMRALARAHLDKFLPQTDYVLIGRFNTAKADFANLEKDFLWGLKKLNKLLTEKKDEK